MKITTNGKKILSLIKKKKKLFSVQEIKKSFPKIDQATVYRNLEKLVVGRYIKKIHIDEKKSLYEFQKEPHAHAVCSECQKIFHINMEDEVLKNIKTKGFEVAEIEVVLKGKCS